MQGVGMGQSASPNGLTHGMRLMTLGKRANSTSSCTKHSQKTHEKRRRRQQEMKETIRSFLLTIPTAAVFVKQRAAPFYGYTRIGMASPERAIDQRAVDEHINVPQT